MRYKLGVGLFIWMLSMVAFAEEPMKPVLNKVSFRVSTEQWVTTKTAEVTIGINATLNEKQLAKAHTDILEKLNTLASTEWHITQFDRNPDQSGLEQLSVSAETRLSETALSDLRERAKALSKPGETFTVQSITFTPTLAETEAVRTQLRSEVYVEVQHELAALNKLYANQHYVVHQIDFLENIAPRQMSQMKMAMMALPEGGAADAAPVTVANKIAVTALVTVVSINA